MAAAMQARRAVFARCSALSRRVITRYVGITAIGSTMNSTDVSVTTANCMKSGIVARSRRWLLGLFERHTNGVAQPGLTVRSFRNARRKRAELLEHLPLHERVAIAY